VAAQQLADITAKLVIFGVFLMGKMGFMGVFTYKMGAFDRKMGVIGIKSIKTPDFTNKTPHFPIKIPPIHQ
jgi:hypothetical protein